MDRARGRFSKGSSNSPGHSNSPQPTTSRGGGSGSNSPYSQGDGKRSRDSPEGKEGQRSKRQRQEPAFGTTSKRRAHVDLEATIPEGVIKSGHGSEAARDQSIVRLKTNYFSLTNRPNLVVYQYHVTIEPTIEFTGMKRGIFFANTQSIRCGKYFDGSSLYTSEKLEQDLIVLTGSRRSKTAETPVTITIKFVKAVSSFEGTSMYQVLNVVMRQVLQGLQLKLVGRNFFDPHAANKIPALRVDVWPGYITSIRQHDGNVLMCCETTSKVMRNETLYQILRNCKDNHHDYQRAFVSQVLGMTVLTDYNNKTYRVDDVDWESHPESTFETKSGPKSYIQYYRERYHLEIRDRRQPLLLSKSKERNRRGGEAEMVSLVPELCRATGLTEDMRSNFQTMRALSDFTRLNPTNRVDRLNRFSRRIRESEESSRALTTLGMTISQNLVELEGRKLNKPALYFGDGSTRIDRDFGNSLRNSLFRPASLEHWYVISTERDSRSAQNFVQQIQRSVRFHINTPSFIRTRGNQIDELVREIDSVARRDPQLIMIISPGNQADRYQAVKKKCCIDRAIPTQVVCAKTINRQNAMSIATKVAIQMTSKIGGAPWGTKMPLSGLLVIGYDVSYDTKDKKISFGALVATLDQYQSVFYSVASQHNEAEQLSKTFTLNVMKAIKEFQKVNGSKPSKIIIYRDGVGDGQIRHILDHEKGPLEAIIKQEYGDTNRFAFIIVNKRTNTRLFSTSGRDGVSNPEPGTVVDTVITLPERYDFYLIPTSVRQGTVSPTYFNVISDTLGLPAAKLQQLTYFLCHAYYNWTDAITVPAVCKYASKLAFLCSQHLHSAPNIWQDKRLYFL